MKSLVKSFLYLSISMRNLFTPALNQFIQNTDGSTNLDGAMYHLFFAGFMAAAALIFIVYMYYYKEEYIVQDEAVQQIND